MRVHSLAAAAPEPRNLLAGIRGALDGAHEALLCVAFASSVGVRLLEPALRSVRALPSGGRLRARADQERACQLLVTTTFGTSTAAALSVAYDAGVDVRVLNPRGGTYHPKVYVGRRDDRVSVVVGSANLTSGLVKNVEAAVLLEGDMRERELAFTLEWARDLWASDDVERWEPSATAEEDVLDPVLFALVDAAVREDRDFVTLKERAVNTVVEVTPHGLFVETAASRAKGNRAQYVPTGMNHSEGPRLDRRPGRDILGLPPGGSR